MCFRRFNATHQIGCSCKQDVLHFLRLVHVWHLLLHVYQWTVSCTFSLKFKTELHGPVDNQNVTVILFAQEEYVMRSLH